LIILGEYLFTLSKALHTCKMKLYWCVVFVMCLTHIVGFGAGQLANLTTKKNNNLKKTFVS